MVELVLVGMLVKSSSSMQKWGFSMNIYELEMKNGLLTMVMDLVKR